MQSNPSTLIRIEASGLSYFRNTRLSRQFVTITVIALASMVVLSGVNALALRNSLLAERQSLIQNAVEIAYNVILTEAARAEKAGEDVSVAKTRAIQQINNMRYGIDEYFFILDVNGLVVANVSAPGLVGKNVYGNADADGRLFVQELINTAANSNGGFTQYEWPRANSDKPVPKLSYSKLYQS